MRLLLTTILFSIVQNLTAQYRQIVFEGAGIRGIAYAGVIKVLEQEELIGDIRKTGGTSAGAITALSLSLGYTAAEIDSIIFHTNFKKFNDGKNIFAGGLHRVNKNYGWYRGQSFSRWIGKIIEAKTGDANITFAQLVAQGYRELYITGTCVNRQQLIVFSHHNYPEMRVKDAIRISMSIPLYFEGVWIDRKGKVYNKAAPGLDLMIDGGLLANFPIQIFDTVDAKGRRPDLYTIGVRIDSEQQIAADQNSRKLIDYPVHDFGDYLGAMYTLLLETPNRNTLTDADWERTVSVSSQNIGPRLRKLTLSEKDSLMRSGESAMRLFLQQHKNGIAK